MIVVSSTIFLTLIIGSDTIILTNRAIILISIIVSETIMISINRTVVLDLSMLSKNYDFNVYDFKKRVL